MVVCHGSGSGSVEEQVAEPGVESTSEIASCNYVARDFGIRNGMSLGRARKMCADIQTIPYDFELYQEVSIQLYSILLAHADAIEAVSVDEALIDVSLLLRDMREGQVREGSDLHEKYKHAISSQGEFWTEERQLAEALRDEIREETRTEASIGIGSNVLLARLATRRAKPGGSYHLQEDAVPSFLAELDIDDLHGIGWSAREKCKQHFGTYRISELLAQQHVSQFASVFGAQKGPGLWSKMNGKDRDRLEASPRKSIGAAVNWGIRFENQEEARHFFTRLAAEVASRMVRAQVAGKKVLITIMVRKATAPVEAPKFMGHGVCDTFNRSGLFAVPTQDARIIADQAWTMMKALEKDPKELRGIGISLQDLSPSHGEPSRPQPKSSQKRLDFKTKALEVGLRKAGVDAAPRAVQFAEAPRESSAVESPTTVTRQSHLIIADDEDDSGSADSVSGPIRQQEVQGTQYILPTQFDEAVLQDLPATIRNKLEKRREKKKEAKPVPIATHALSFSQIDQETLDELPLEIKQEILRGYAALPIGRVPSPEPRAPPAPVAGPSKRAKTESPRKKPSVALTKSPSKLKKFSMPEKGQPSIDRMTIWLANPGALTHADLEELGVDREFYEGLPREIQRDVIREEYKNVNSRRARSKVGHTVVEMTRADRRAENTRRALEAERANGVDGERPVLTAHRERLNSLGNASSVEEIRSALMAWVEYGKNSGPTENDSNMVGTLFERLLRPDTTDSPDLEKAQVLFSWLEMLVAQAWPDEGTKQGSLWRKAVAQMLRRMHEIMCQDFGFPLAL